MSACEEVKDRLCEFLDGELAQADRSVVESHIQGCSACREELAALRRASSAVHALERQAAPAAVLAGVRAGLKEVPPAPEPKVVRPEPSFWWRRAMSVAAILIVAALIYLAYSPDHFTRRASAPEGARHAEKARVAPSTGAAKKAVPADRARASDGAETARDSMEAAAAVDEEVLLPFAGKPAAKRAAPKAKFKSSAMPQPGFTKRKQPAPPPAAPPVGIGTPPHIMEGASKGPTQQPVIQQLKEGLDLTQRNDKADAGQLAGKALENEARGKSDGQVETAQVRPVAKPKAQSPSLPPAPTRTSPQTSQHGGLADARQTVEKPRSTSPAKVARTQIDERQQNEFARQEQARRRVVEAKKGDVASAREAANAPLADRMKSTKAGGVEQAKDAADSPTPTRRVLNVPERDVARVLGDLQRMAEASGGKLAWLPAAGERTAKKEAVAQAFRSAWKSESDRVVIRVPRENMDVLLRAASEYQAERELEREVAETKPQPQGRDVARAEALDTKLSRAKKRPGATEPEKYVRLVVEILPQATAAAARSEVNPPAKAKTKPAK